MWREGISKVLLALVLREQLSTLVLVACDGGLIGVAQQFLQHVWIASCLQIPHGKSLAEQGWADTLARDPGPFPESAKQERNGTLGEKVPRLREEEVILIGASLLETRCGS